MVYIQWLLRHSFFFFLVNKRQHDCVFILVCMDCCMVYCARGMQEETQWPKLNIICSSYLDGVNTHRIHLALSPYSNILMSELTEHKNEKNKMQFHDTWKWIRLAFYVWEFWALNRNYTTQWKWKTNLVFINLLICLKHLMLIRLWCNTLLWFLWRDEKNIVLLVCLWWWICNAKGIYGNEISEFDWRRQGIRAVFFYRITLSMFYCSIASYIVTYPWVRKNDLEALGAN